MSERMTAERLANYEAEADPSRWKSDELLQALKAEREAYWEQAKFMAERNDRIIELEAQIAAAQIICEQYFKIAETEIPAPVIRAMLKTALKDSPHDPA